jgi:CelD/BcsL family acetyltransferase involved in cellulose biosynthesis
MGSAPCVICGRLYDGIVLAAELIREPADLDPWLGQWDSLSIERSMPYGGPAWTLGWWRHVAGGTRELNVVVVRDGDELVGLCPTFAQISSGGLREYRMLGAGSSHRIGPVAKPGREADVAEAAARVLHNARPRLSTLVFEAADAASPWPQLLRQAWPGALRPRRHVGLVMAAPVVTIEGDFDSWLKGRSSSFRKQMRYQRRRLEERGARISAPDSQDERARALEAMFRLHWLRWEAKGGESDLTREQLAQLEEVAATLDASRLRLWCVDVDGEYISVQLHMAAGGDVSYWNGGFDPAWEELQPSMVTLLAALEDAFARGDKRLDLGGGDQPYKRRFADNDAPLIWTSIFPRNRRYPVTRAQLLPKETRLHARNVARRMPAPVRDGIRRVRRRRGVA